MEILNDSLSDFIKLLRHKHKYSQADMAIKLKISRNTYSNWETNPVKLNLDTLMQIGKVLDEDILIFFNIYVAKSNLKDGR